MAVMVLANLAFEVHRRLDVQSTGRWGGAETVLVVNG